MFRAALCLVAALAAAPLMASPSAADAPNAANLYTQPDARAIAIQNWTSGAITHAEVQTTPDGRTWNLANGHIPKNEAAEVAVPARDCIANVRVKLQNGHVLQLAGLHDCKDTQIAVRDEKIWIPKLAIPGAKQHATPG